MSANRSRPRSRRAWIARFAALGLLFALPGCSDGSDGEPGQGGTPSEPPLTQGDPLPGFHVEILGVRGGTGENGNVLPGDHVRVDFTVTDDTGATIPPAQWSRGAILVSGPSFNYQRVIPILGDLAARVTTNGDGSFTYEFADPFPATYAAPYNYTGAQPAGVLAGQALLDGTYTVSIEARQDVQVGNRLVHDGDNQVQSFLVGGATLIEERAVVGMANCIECHKQIRAHGDNRTNLTGCLLCHTIGAEDPNPPDVEGGTPGVSIDFRVMIHKIHTGRSLPSVLGMTTNPDGTRDYAVAEKPYLVLGYQDSVHDFSHIAWPKWPVVSQPMPRDGGYQMLSPTDQEKEDLQRSGPTDCSTCHGDPDGSGPAPAPAQGDIIWRQQSRSACGSCHEDVIWDQPYRSNSLIMPPQPTDANCMQCHLIEGTPLSVMDAHRHPLLDPAVSKGVNFHLTSVSEAGTNDGDGTFDPGERIQLEFTIEDVDGAPVDPTTLFRGEIAITGPTENPQLLHLTTLPTGAIGPGPTYTIHVPETLQLERVGTSTSASNESFMTNRSPLWPGTTVWLRTASGNTSTLDAAAPKWQNFVDVADGSQFARNDIVAIDGGTEGVTMTEYLKVQWVDGDRLWFSSKNNASYKATLRLDHPMGANVQAVSLTMQSPGTNYTLDEQTGTIHEVGDMGSGDVVVTYTSDFEVPPVYTGTINDSPDLDSAAGDWLGLSLVSGTYSIGIWAVKSLPVTFPPGGGDPTLYTEAAPAEVQNVLFGDATTIEPDMRISSADNCYACHRDIDAHGAGRRGYQGCILCHGAAGAEDRPRYVAADAPPTTGLTVDFWTMLHKIHDGDMLAEGAGYQVVGYASSAYPQNFSIATFEEIAFPAWPGGTAQCAACHGADNNAWKRPAPRVHPGGQPEPTRVWSPTCGSCHDSTSAEAHILVNTSTEGYEACGACHGEGQQVLRRARAQVLLTGWPPRRREPGYAQRPVTDASRTPVVFERTSPRVTRSASPPPRGRG